MTMALGQLLDGICEPVHLHLPNDRARNLRGALVLYELAHLRGVGVRAKWLVETRGVPQRALQVANVLYRPAEPPGHVLVGGLVLHLGGELVVGAGHLTKLVTPVHGHPYGAALVGHCTLHGLPDPPGGIRGESPAAVGIELLDGLHQADIALLDQVLERQSLAPVLLGYAHDEPQVLLYEPLAGTLVSGLGPLGEVYLLGVREQLALVDVSKVPGDEIRGLGGPPRITC